MDKSLSRSNGDWNKQSRAHSGSINLRENLRILGIQCTNLLISELNMSKYE